MKEEKNLFELEFERLKDWPRWELLNTKKALESLGGFFNTEEDDARLAAIKKILKSKK